jgi:lipopolysaccharide transport system permease protein
LIFQKQHWPGHTGSNWSYALILFAGLAPFNAFAEVLQRAPLAVIAQPNLVKKVVFPLEILPAVLVGSALVSLAISLSLVGVGSLCSGQSTLLSWGVLLILPFLLWLQGLAWLLAAVGTFLRDIGPMTIALCPLLLFLSPIFYPVSVVPAKLQWLIWANPLAVVVEAVRGTMVSTPEPPIGAVLWLITVSMVTWQLGYAVMQRLRPEMADVV